MRLVSADILDFRNLAEVQLRFSPGVNLLVGDNGQGKSNLLEALNYPSLGRSFRGARDDDLVRFDAECAHVRLTAKGEDDREVEFEYGIERGRGRRFRVDGEPVKRKVDLLGRLTTVVFDPQTVQLVRGGPEARRRYLDQGLSMVDAGYLLHLQAYNRALKQKNRLLRDARRGFVAPAKVREDLRVWNLEMASHAAPICSARASYAAGVEPHVADAYSHFADRVSEVAVKYEPQLGNSPKDAPEGQLEADILGKFDYIIEDELRRGRSLAGPHMDDFEVQLDGINLRSFGSQGETRTAAIALKLAQGDLVHLKRRVRPVLFFDDIFSELDRGRTGKLQERTGESHQIFIATAREEDVTDWRPVDLRSWSVRAGGVTELV